MQYPVFPWLLRDHDADVINVSMAASFRDLAWPMGAQTEGRAAQFRRWHAARASGQGSEHPRPRRSVLPAAPPCRPTSYTPLPAYQLHPRAGLLATPPCRAAEGLLGRTVTPCLATAPPLADA